MPGFTMSARRGESPASPPAEPAQTPAVSRVRKLQPKVLNPSSTVMARLEPADRELIQHLITTPQTCVFDPSFRTASTEKVLLGPLPASKAKRGKNGNDDSGVDLLSMARTQTIKLTAEQERHLFLRYNYARYRVMRILRSFQGKRLTLAAIEALLRWERLARHTRAEIVYVNRPLVLAMTKRAHIPLVDNNDLVGEGNLALMRSIDKFDASRGFKFSTYACRAILTAFARLAKQASRQRQQFPVEFDPALQVSDFLETRRAEEEEGYVDELSSILARNLADLNPSEQWVIRERFALGRRPGLGRRTPAKTLQEIADGIGISKERVRQIQNQAFEKLRTLLEGRMDLTIQLPISD